MPKAKTIETNTESNEVEKQDKKSKNKQKQNDKQEDIQPLILVDTSYTSFYRFFATIRWYSFAYPEEFKEFKANAKYDWKTNKIFIVIIMHLKI